MTVGRRVEILLLFPNQREYCHHFAIKHDVYCDVFCKYHTLDWEIYFYSDFVGILNHNWVLHFIKCFLCIHWDYRMIFLFFFVHLTVYTNGCFFKDFQFQQQCCCFLVLSVGPRGPKDFSRHLFSTLLHLPNAGSLMLHLVPPQGRLLVTWCCVPGESGKVLGYFAPVLILQCPVHLGLSCVAFSVFLPIPLIMLTFFLDSGVIWWEKVSCSSPSGSRSLHCVRMRFWAQESYLLLQQGLMTFASTSFPETASFPGPLGVWGFSVLKG